MSNVASYSKISLSELQGPMHCYCQISQTSQSVWCAQKHCATVMINRLDYVFQVCLNRTENPKNLNFDTPEVTVLLCCTESLLMKTQESAFIQVIGRMCVCESLVKSIWTSKLFFRSIHWYKCIYKWCAL